MVALLHVRTNIGQSKAAVVVQCADMLCSTPIQKTSPKIVPVDAWKQGQSMSRSLSFCGKSKNHYNTILGIDVAPTGLPGRQLQDSHDCQYLPSCGELLRDSQHPQICQGSQEGQESGIMPTAACMWLSSNTHAQHMQGTEYQTQSSSGLSSNT